MKMSSYEYKSFGDESIHLAIENINITVNKGEHLVILGHNGSGKSTLAKMMNGLLLPTSGGCICKWYEHKRRKTYLEYKGNCRYGISKS